jgi:hypothetical protein
MGNDFGYVQAIQVKDTIYLSGQLSHDSDGNFVAPAELDKSGRPVDYSQMEQQFRQTYVNAKKMLLSLARRWMMLLKKGSSFLMCLQASRPPPRFARKCTIRMCLNAQAASSAYLHSRYPNNSSKLRSVR